LINFGNYSLLISFFLSVLVCIGLLVGIKRKDGRFIEASYRGAKGVFFFFTMATCLLVYVFINDDFRIEYVVSYSEINLPIFYKITGLWAGQKGSLLFWGWLMSLFTFITIKRDEKKVNSFFLPYVLMCLNLTVLFFLFVINFVTPPFELIARIPQDGNGLNPLLQNPGMVFHPPTLYLGYVGFTVPFSFAMAALYTGDVGDWWIKKTRAWTLFSWVLLTVGIVFGGWWAYSELGWGGVWAWDPVENASLMPWFTATAFLHSVTIQERRGMMKVWNLFLILLTFALSIFGTFITRSGIITSVHAFGQSSVGYVFLGFLLVMVALGTYLILTRYEKLKEKNPRIESLLSKESSFLYNNILFLGLAFATFWGTIFPLISEAVKGVKISVGPVFFNTVNSPLFLILLIIMAICPLLAWRRTSSKGALKNFLIPSSLMIASLPLLYVLGIRDFLPILFYAFSVFVIVSLSREFYIGTRAGVKHRGESWMSSFLNLITKNRRRYGGFTVHVGVIMMVVGLVSYGYYQFKEDFNLVPGQEITVKNYRLKYLGLRSFEKSNYSGVGAIVDIYNSGEFEGTLRPEKRFYSKQEPTTEVAIMNTFSEDLYLILGSWEQNNSIALTVVINPFLSWLWIGTGVVVLGVIWAVIPRRKKEREVDIIEKDILFHLQEARIK
jgi:cytochrome c-type biogenesis protein CcmF